MTKSVPKNLGIPEKWGLLTAAGLTVFLFLMKAIGLLHVVELRALNVFILVGGVVAAIKIFKRKKPESFNYFSGMVLGIHTAAIGSIVFAVFVFFYVSFLDPSLMTSIVENEPMGRFLNPYMVSFIIALEGVFSGLLVTFIAMNYYGAEE